MDKYLNSGRFASRINKSHPKKGEASGFRRNSIGLSHIRLLRRYKIR